MRTFRDATDADRVAWQALVERCPTGDFLQDWAWADVAAHDGEPQRRFILESDGEPVVVAAAQVRHTTLGRQFWYVPHGPVLDLADPEAAGRVADTVAGLRSAAAAARAVAVKLEPRIELGDARAAAFDGRDLRVTGERVQIGQTRLVDISVADDALIASFDKDTRYAIRRSEREGVTVACTREPSDLRPIDNLHALVAETQRRAGFPLPSLERYRIAWRALAGEGHAAILEARRGDTLLASGMLVAEGDRSFYLFSGSRREEPGEPKHYASYALQWEMMRVARSLGSRSHDLWGIPPEGAGPEHAWHGVGLFKKGFGGRVVVWAPSRDLVVDPVFYRARRIAARARQVLRR